VVKATHTPWARIAAKVMMGKCLAELGAKESPVVIKGAAGVEAPAYAVKESVFPFNKFPGVDVILGPEMRSTGEVMGIDRLFPLAFAKASLATGCDLPTEGNVFISVRAGDRPRILEVARTLHALGMGLYATDGTAAYLAGFGIPATVLQKLDSNTRPNVIDLMTDGKIQLVINTPTRTGYRTDEGRIRAATVRLGIPTITTATAAIVASQAIAQLRRGDWGVRAMQDYRTGPCGCGAAGACGSKAPSLAAAGLA
jgi:carbamoyl-phosphate synthase large subunit